MSISREDVDFIQNVLMPLAGVNRLYIAYSNSRKKWPDIWVEKGRIPKITVTQEWARQGKHERRKRLVHEFLHLKGLGHDEKIGYSTYPSRDSYSMRVYREVIR